MPSIKIVINAAGKPTVSGEGFSGDACHKGLAPILDAFSGAGNNVTEEMKPEAAMLTDENEDTQHLTV